MKHPRLNHLTTWYEADRDLMGSGKDTCGHKHRTAEAARRCLPKIPKNRSGSLTQYFSMAQVRKFTWEHDGSH